MKTENLYRLKDCRLSVTEEDILEKVRELLPWINPHQDIFYHDKIKCLMLHLNHQMLLGIDMKYLPWIKLELAKGSEIIDVISFNYKQDDKTDFIGSISYILDTYKRYATDDIGPFKKYAIIRGSAFSDINGLVYFLDKDNIWINPLQTALMIYTCSNPKSEWIYACHDFLEILCNDRNFIAISILPPNF